MGWLKQKWVRALISLGLLAWLARSIDWAQLAQVSVGMAWPWAVAAGVLYTMNRWLTTAKWWLLMRSQGLHHPFNELLHVVWVSNFLGHFLPASIGGDHVRMFTMASRSPKAPEMVSTVLMERMTGTSSLGLLALLGASWSATRWGQALVLWAILPPAVVLVAGAQFFWSDAGQRVVRGALARWQWLPGRGFLQQLYDALRGYRHHGLAVLQAFGISMLIQFSRVLAVYFLARGLSITLFLGEALVLVPTALFLGALPISVAGWGVREGAFVMLLGMVGVGSAAAFALSVWSRLMALISNLPGSFLYFSSGFAGVKHFTPAAAAPGPVKVLRVMDKLGYDDRMYGPARMWYTCLPALQQQPCQVDAYVLRGQAAIETQFAQQGTPLHTLNRGRFDPMTVVALYRLIRQEQYALVHLDGDGATTFGRLAAWWAGVPAIVHYQDTAEGLPWYMRILDAALAPLTARAVAISQTVAEACVRRRRIPRARVVLVPNAVDPAWAQPVNGPVPATLRQQLGIPAEAPVIGTVTRFQPVKNVPLFLEAVARLRAQMPQVHAVVVGDGPERAMLEARIQALGLQACVHLAGYQADVRPFVSLMAVLVFTSRSEGFCLALLEAMALGKPVVVTAVPAFQELVAHGRSGLIVPLREPQALATVIAQVLQDATLRQRLATGARARAEEFSVERHVARLVALYEEVGSATRRGA